jgi:hypothetical protein
VLRDASIKARTERHAALVKPSALMTFSPLRPPTTHTGPPHEVANAFERIDHPAWLG